MSIHSVLKALAGVRFPLVDEKELQAAIGEQLASAGLDMEREVRLAPGDIVDFMVGGTAIEVKIKGSRRAILRQCERYAAYERVRELVLLTNVATGFPDALSGKPVAVFSLGRAWL